jgi:hypothetical protein
MSVFRPYNASTEGGEMEDVVRYRAFEAFCRQRAKMEGEGSAFWLEEADLLARLTTDALRLPMFTAEADVGIVPNLGVQT